MTEPLPASAPGSDHPSNSAVSGAPTSHTVCPEHLDQPLASTPFAEVSSTEGLVRIPGIGRALVTDSGIVAVTADDRAAHLDPAEIAAVLEPPAIALSLLLAGRFPLRGTAISIDGRALVVLGVPHEGVSAVAAALTQRGHQLLADRQVVITGDQPHVQPTSTSVDLWPAELEHLGLSADAGIAVRRGLPVRRISVPSASDVVPLGLVVELHQDNHVVSPRVETLRGFDAIDPLVRQTWHGWAIGGKAASPAHMAWSLSIVRATRLIRVTVRRKPTQAATTADLLRALALDLGDSTRIN